MMCNARRVVPGSHVAETVAAAEDLRMALLLAEDNEVNRFRACACSRSSAAPPTSRGERPRGVERTEARDYDLVFMDCQMPEMDGSRRRAGFAHARRPRAGTSASWR